MKALIFILTYPIIALISRLPFSILYKLSDVLRFIFFNVFKYRKEIIYSQLKGAFPDKTTGEILDIQYDFEQHFCDVLVETIKCINIEEEEIKKRVTVRNPSILGSYHNSNKSVIIAMGHTGNWEMAGLRFSLEKYHCLSVLYHPLSNPHFDQVLKKMRVKWGNNLYPMHGAYREILNEKDQLTATVFIADQSPKKEQAFWIPFLHQETPFYTGIGKIARKISAPIVYVRVVKKERGKYEIEFSPLVDIPEAYSSQQIVEAYAKELERDIRLQPYNWLWSHRRWKHKKAIARSSFSAHTSKAL